MKDSTIQKYGEIQYLKGRLDELFKGFPNITELHESRLMDMRIQKYMDKLKDVDEISYHCYMVELSTRRKSKERSKKYIKQLLQDTLSQIQNEELRERILYQIDKY
jgi:hypothetical protein